MELMDNINYTTNFTDEMSNFTDGIFECVEEPLDLEELIFNTVVYLMYFLISAVATVGNGVICYIIITSTRMRTVTNYFIMNLAIGDLLIAVLCVPFTSVAMLEQYWPFGSFLCPVVSYFQAIAVFVSSYSLVAISLDRYVAIIWPLKPRMSKKFALCIILAVWILSCVSVIPTLIFTYVVQPNDDHHILCDKYICKENWPTMEDEYWYSQGLLLFQYLVPVTVFIFAYTSIAAVIWCHRIPGEAENCRDQRIARSKRKMIRMMVAVVLVYTLCWLPYNLYWVVNTSIPSHRLRKYLFFAFHVLAMSHACYNPIIYSYMNSRFRAGILSALPCCRKCIASLLTRRSKSSTSLPLTSLEGTDSTLLNRDNTYTTFVSMRHRTGSRLASTHRHLHQVPVRSASVMRSHNQSSKTFRYPHFNENQI